MGPTERFARNMRVARAQHGLSQEALAHAAGIHRTEVSLLERGMREPRLGTIVRVARAMKLAPTELLAGIR
jgi:transcriptional regulator with XRE-family HTH domain